MKRIASLGLGILTLLMVACSSLPGDPRDIPPQIVEWGQRNAWEVRFDSENWGSAFWVNERIIISACHVVNVNPIDGKRFEVRSEDMGQSIFVTVATCNEKTDIALLVPDENHGFKPSTTRLALKPPSQGKAVWGVGYPMGQPLTMTFGHWQKKKTTPGKVGEFATVTTISGDSGSPALSLHNGKVVVEAVRVAVRAQRFGFAPPNFVTHLVIVVPAYMVLDEINAYRSKRK